MEKLGKFLGNFGILSGQDPHNWDFADQALVYSVFFGEHGINELGAQVLWKAPIHMKLIVGAEILEGKNEMSTINIIRNKILSRIFAVVNRGTPYANTFGYIS